MLLNERSASFAYIFKRSSLVGFEKSFSKISFIFSKNTYWKDNFSIVVVPDSKNIPLKNLSKDSIIAIEIFKKTENLVLYMKQHVLQGEIYICKSETVIEHSSVAVGMEWL